MVAGGELSHLISYLCYHFLCLLDVDAGLEDLRFGVTVHVFIEFLDGGLGTHQRHQETFIVL